MILSYIILQKNFKLEQTFTKLFLRFTRRISQKRVPKTAMTLKKIKKNRAAHAWPR